jgi:MFS family permease
MIGSAIPATRVRLFVERPAARGWLIAVAVYFLAVFHRSSLGVAGLLAEHRFGITGAQLSVFVVLQIGVYAAMQIPTGVLVDRYGPRRLLVVAAALMGLGQLLFAVAPSYGVALLARALLGCGDAMTFVSVLRFAALHFSPRRYPVLVALTSTIGMAGNLLATLPLTLLLGSLGWTASYAMAASLSLVCAVAVWRLVDDRVSLPPRLRTASDVRAGLVAVSRRVASAWRMPGTRLGFWVHFASMSTATSFGVLWGVPYLERGAGFSTAGAGSVLLGGVLLAGLASPVIGALIGRHPAVRVPIALGVCTMTILGWAGVALFGGDHPPRVLVAALFVVTTLGGPASMAAFALARDYNPARIVGTASGVVNVGGFVATVIVSVAFGVVLDRSGGSGAHGMRVALAVPVLVQTVALLLVLLWYLRVRALAVVRQEAGEPVPVAVVRTHWWDISPDRGRKTRAQRSPQNLLVGQGDSTSS